MAELSKILQKEEAQRREVEKAREQAQEAVEKKKQDLAQDLEKASISKEQEQKVLAYKKAQIKDIEKTAKQGLEAQLAGLQQKEKTNTKTAVEYIVGTLLSKE